MTKKSALRANFAFGVFMCRTVLMFLSDWETQIVFAALSIGQFEAKRNPTLQMLKGQLISE